MFTFFPLVMTSLRNPDIEMRPFVLNHRSAVDSPVDVAFLNQGPAGKDGFIGIKNGHFVDGKSQRIRFWGVHLTDWSRGSVMIPPKEDAPMWAATLARHGVNIVRLHFLDLASPRGIIDGTKDTSQEFDTGQVDRLDFMVSELKKRGIFVDLNLNVGRSYKPGDGLPETKALGWAKGVVYYNQRLIELQKDYARKLLTHKNPYLGTRYVDEPSVALVEMVNENALWVGFKPPAAPYEEELNRLYNDWLENNVAKDALERLRKEAGVADGSPIPRLAGRQVGSASAERLHAELGFCAAVEGHYYDDMKAYLKGLGVRVPIIGTADHAHNGASYPMIRTLSRLDVMDGHMYWLHPGSPRDSGPMVNDPINSTVVSLARTAVSGKPYTVSETNHPFPDEYLCEGIPILAAYAGLQDWDMVVQYTFEPKRDPDHPPSIGDPFDISTDPVRMANLAAGALMFRRGDVAAANRVIERTYSPEQVEESLRAKEGPFFTPGYPMLSTLVSRVRIKSFDGPPTASYPAVTANPVVSDTRELSWFTSADKGGLVRIDTPKTQSLVGFIHSNKEKSSHLAVDIENNFAAIMLSSLDDRPITISHSMLLTATSRVANTGTAWNAERTKYTNWGTAPTVIEPVTGVIALLAINGAKAITAFPTDGSGKTIGNGIKATQDGPNWKIKVGDIPAVRYLIRVER